MAVPLTSSQFASRVELAYSTSPRNNDHDHATMRAWSIRPLSALIRGLDIPIPSPVDPSFHSERILLMGSPVLRSTISKSSAMAPLLGVL